MKNRTLGTIALIGAPCLFISFQFPSTTADAVGDSAISNAFGLLYLIGWMCSVTALHRMGATGNTFFGKALIPLLLVSLTIASISNIYAMILPQNTELYFYIDLFWPISNLLMFITGITVAAANKLKGWKRFVPLAVGIWFPLMVISMALIGRTPATGLALGLYAAFAWSGMAIMVMETKGKPEKNKKFSRLDYVAADKVLQR
ncbi:hypothetical protein [Cesiribacter sp. SM1]|uniref:hypothetical protein n=1 Tax=Cesiribacter sp. SM1 TaxID=2861196 RepID=UPI001CD2042C|nr:hypothetical protein [Cesiribacter sp. SM1]